MIIFNFSVLARPAESLPLRQPDSAGRSIWSMFYEANYGRLCLVIDEVYDKPLVEEWLKREGFKPSYYEFIDEVQPVLKAEKVHRLASIFGKASWYVDTDPAVCAETMKLGIPSIVVAVPYIIRPEWDSGRVVKPWDTLVEEVNKQALKAAERQWRDSV